MDGDVGRMEGSKGAKAGEHTVDALGIGGGEVAGFQEVLVDTVEKELG